MLVYRSQVPSDTSVSSVNEAPRFDKVYRRRNRPTSDSTPVPPSSLADPISGAPSDDPPSGAPSHAPDDTPTTPTEADSDLPIALRKGKRSCTYPIASFVSYEMELGNW